MYSSFRPLRAAFPEGSFSFSELIFLRSWQAEGIVRFLYFINLFISLFVFVYIVVSTTIALGVGGFFLGFFVGVIVLIFGLLSTRVGCELVLSVFVIRDSIDTLASSPVSNRPPSSVGGNIGTGTVGVGSYQQASSVPQQQYESL